MFHSEIYHTTAYLSCCSRPVYGKCLLSLKQIFGLKSSGTQGSYCWHFISFIAPLWSPASVLRLLEWVVYSGRVVSGATTLHSSEGNVKCSPRLAKSCTRPHNGDTSCTLTLQCNCTQPWSFLQGKGLCQVVDKGKWADFKQGEHSVYLNSEPCQQGQTVDLKCSRIVAVWTWISP